MAKQTFTSGQTLTAQQMSDLQSNDFNQTVSTKIAAYTFVVGDRGTRVVLNDTTARTFTINDSIFSAGDTINVHNINTGTLTIAAGAGVTLNSAGSLDFAQWEGGLIFFTSAASAIVFRGGGIGYGTATGGSSSSITVGGQNYTLLTFTSSSTLTVTKAGLFDVLVCSGGAGGAAGISNVSGGGGGAGGILQATVYLDANTTIQIGAGGADSTSGSSSAIDSTARSLSVAGGGRGGGRGGSFDAFESALGGSGGGGASIDSGRNLGSASMAPSISGSAGGDGVAAASSGGGGGGGAAAVGSAGVSTTGGAGGAGFDVSAFIGGASLFKCGGGGGGGATGGAGGSSVGAAGGSNAAGNAAAANTGSGGGGAGFGATRVGGAGGSGIVFIRMEV